MNHIRRVLVTIAIMLAVVVGGCSGDKGASEEHGSERTEANRGEHDRDGAEHGREGGHSEEGEE